MPSSIIVRPVTRADHDQWLPLWDGYNAFYGRSGPTALAPAITQMTWQRFFDGYEPMYALVAESDGKLVGLVHYLFHRNTTMLGPVCYLQDLFTDASQRGKGVGKALIEAVYDKAKAADSPRVYWHTHETNHTAMKLYNHVATHSGFVVYRKDL
jgi:GNAT superfamily N-acetyltransferase